MPAENKNYNYLALRGAGVDDMELVEHYGLDPSLAYTKDLVPTLMEINEAENARHYVEEGMDQAAAAAKAKDNRMKAERDYKELLAKNGMLK